MARDGATGERVLIVETLGAPSAAHRRRRRPRQVESAEPPLLPLTRATAIRAFEAFASVTEASRWLDGATEAEDTVEALIEEGIGLLNLALHAQATASGDPHSHELAPDRALSVRLGYGSGQDLAGGRFETAREIDMRATGVSRRRQRTEELRPQERVAAVLGGREQIDACETLLLRARADLDGGREREAALQLRAGLEALLVELRGALADPDHVSDMAELDARRGKAGEAANMALRGDLDAERQRDVRELTEICERVLRRRRVLRG